MGIVEKEMETTILTAHGPKCLKRRLSVDAPSVLL